MKREKIYTLILIIILVATAITRIAGFKNPHALTFDEGLYPQLAYQLKEHPFYYTSRPTYEQCAKKGRSLPEYLNRPLYKHPPLYPYIISLIFYFVSQPIYQGVWSVSLLSGIFLVILIYLIGRILYDRKVAIVAAFLLFLDPIHWICTQKIWMEITLVAFIWSALFFIIKALLDSNHKYYYWAGLATGCALLTKYTAFMLFPIGFSLVLIYNHDTFKSRHFWSWPLISLLFFAPWLVWNYLIYGSGFLWKMIEVHPESIRLLLKLNNTRLLICASSIVFLFTAILLLRKKIGHISLSPLTRTILLSLVAVALFGRSYMIHGLVNMFDLSYIPKNGWTMHMFAGEPWYFYFRRLIELSPFYIFAFGSIFFLAKPHKSYQILLTVNLWIFILVILWGNYQSRYILPAVPALLLLSSRTIIWIIEKMKKFTDSKILLLTYCIVIIFILCMFWGKAVFIDAFLAFPNKTCYF